MKHYFKIVSILPVKNLEDGITSHTFIVSNKKNNRRFTFIVMNTNYDLSMISEGRTLLFESNTNLYQTKRDSTILFEIRPNLRTFTERDVQYRGLKEGIITLVIEPPHILTYPIEFIDEDRMN